MTNNETKDIKDIKGKLTYEDRVIEKIVGIALESIDGLLEAEGGFFSNIKDKLVNSDNVGDGINVEVGQKQVAIDLDIIAEYRKNIPEIYKAIKRVSEEEVKRMTGLEVVEVNVNVVDIKTKAQYEEDSVSVQDRLMEAGKATGDFATAQYSKATKGINNLTSSDSSRVI